MDTLISEDRILWPSDAGGRPRRKAFLSELRSEFTGFSTVIGEVGDGLFTRDGTADIDSLFGTRLFDFPKPQRLIRRLIEQAGGDQNIVLDFFAGSGTTGHSVMEQNVSSSSRQRYILVQLPEPLDVLKKEQQTAAYFCDKLGKPRNIAELTKERLRRAAKKIRDENPSFDGDLGFRVFKLDTSNVRVWEPELPLGENIFSRLLDSIENIKPDRSEEDLLYELLLKLGLDLCVSMEIRSIADKRVYAVGAGTLFVCLDETIDRTNVEGLGTGIADWCDKLAPAGEATVVFRDNAFVDDVAKTNLAAILEQRGLHNVRSL